MRTFIATLFITTAVYSADLPTPVIPNPEAFIGWTSKPYDIDEIDFSKLKTKPFSCGEKLLKPLSSDQSTKKYHKFVIGTYNHAKLRGDSEACATASPTNYCLRPDLLQYTIMSDTFADSCGNTYRGFWEVLFLSRNENMGTLSSLGRTFYKKASSQFPGEYETGPTYLVESKEFLFFTELFASDTKN